MNKILTNIVRVKNLWGGVVPLHFLGAWAIYNIATGSAPAWWLATFCIGYFLANIMGIAIGYHRYFSHRGFEINRPMKIFLLFCGVLSMQGSAIFWAGVHNGGHHRNADTELDPHSPIHGFWHSFIFWQFKIDSKDVRIKSIPHLLRDDDVMFFHKNYNIIFWIVHLVVALISIDLWLYLLVLPAISSLYAYGLLTSTTHIRSLGYRNSETRDNSVNAWFNFFFTFGECWHNNHHADPKNPQHGGKRWWEIDPNYWIIQLIRK